METEHIPRLAAAGLSAGAVVLCGAGYALCLALGRARRSAGLRHASLIAYAGVVLAAATLCWALELRGPWLLLVAVLLVGYFVAPRAVWRLSVATHEQRGGGDDG